MKINYVIVYVVRVCGPFISFYPNRRCSVPMGNSNSARRHHSRSVSTSPEVRLRFRLKSPYYIIKLNNSRRFNIHYFFLHTFSDEFIVNFYCYIGFLDPPYTPAVSQTYRPRSLRDFINCKIHLLPTVSTYTLLSFEWDVGILLNFTIILLIIYYCTIFRITLINVFSG